MRHLIAIPVYNEERYLPRVLAAVRRFSPDILVINDGSTDSTGALLRQNTDVQVITHPENRGYGQSLIDAFKFAACRNFDWVITVDCDEQHEPEFAAPSADAKPKKAPELAEHAGHDEDLRITRSGRAMDEALPRSCCG